MIRKGVLWLHKWLGITSGAVVLLVSLSGAIYVFTDELKLWFQRDRYVLPEAESGTPMPLSALIDIAGAHLPAGEHVSRVDLYPAKDRSWAFRAVATNPEGFGLWNYFEYYKRVFINPYTGAVVGSENALQEFFQLTLELHMNLWLGKTYGYPIVSYATLIFVVMLLSGIVLWWPRSSKRKALRRAFWLNISARRKRFNYDLHNVLGFYSFFVALILGITGLLFSFPIFQRAYIGFFNSISPAPMHAAAPATPEYIPMIHEDPLDNTLAFLLSAYPDAAMMSIRLRAPESPQVDVQVRLREGRTGDFVWFYVEKNTHRIADIVRSSELQTGDKLAALNYDIHTGGIGGVLTQLLACFISLFCASLPVTGYILWWNKAKKRK